MIQFYAPDIAVRQELPETESAHCCRVLRKNIGDEIIVVDGKGNRFFCEITKSNPVRTEFIIKEKIEIKPEKTCKITLAVAPTKNSDRLEWMVEKCVEIGVDKIVLLRCSRSERKFQKSERLIKIMISAMKQSLSAELPELVEMTDIKDFLDSVNPVYDKFFGYCSDKFAHKEFIKEYKGKNNVVIMIGPEGDFTPDEVEMAVNNGFNPVTFGEKRLRTETAGVFAISAVNIINRLHD